MLENEVFEMLLQEPAKIQKFMKTFVTKNGDYVFKCNPGYEYDKNSPEEKNKEQRIRCIGNGTYLNVNTGEMASTFPIKPCQKVKNYISEVIKQLFCNEMFTNRTLITFFFDYHTMFDSCNTKSI